MTNPVHTKIVALTPKGEGVGEVRGKPLLVPGALPGEEVRVHVLGGGQKQSYGRLLQVMSPSEVRTTPPCSIAKRCGGCALQHMDVGFQKEWKETMFQELFERAELAIAVEPLRTYSEGEGSRTKGQFMIAEAKGGGYILGLYASHTHRVIPVSRCMIQDQVIQEIMEQLSERIHFWEEVHGVRGVLFRSNGSEALLTWLVEEDFSEEDLVELNLATQDLSQVAGIFINRSSSDSNVLLGSSTQRLSGKKTLAYTLDDFSFEAGPVSFIQTSLEGAAILVEEVRKRAPKKIHHLVDLYGGIGLFALALESRSERVTVVDQDGASIRDGRVNLGDRAEVICSDVGELGERLQDVDVVVVDPPRAGLSISVRKALYEQWKPARIIYVSCSAKSFVRDLKDFATHGYQVGNVSPVDLFPHTPHMEFVTHLERVD